MLETKQRQHQREFYKNTETGFGMNKEELAGCCEQVSVTLVWI